MKTLFENQSVVKSRLATVREFLSEPENISAWADGIRLEKLEDAQKYRFLRVSESLNAAETLKVLVEAQKVSYNIQGSRLNYKIEFSLAEKPEGTEIVERLLIEDENQLNLALKFMKPVIQHEFKGNLENLSRVLR